MHMECPHRVAIESAVTLRTHRSMHYLRIYYSLTREAIRQMIALGSRGSSCGAGVEASSESHRIVDDYSIRELGLIALVPNITR